MLPRLISRSPVRSLARGYATQLKGRADILAKRPDDVVITFAKRTALGRAKKGQLKDVPVDELLHALFRVLVSCDCFVYPETHCLLGHLREDKAQPCIA